MVRGPKADTATAQLRTVTQPNKISHGVPGFPVKFVIEIFFRLTSLTELDCKMDRIALGAVKLQKQRIIF